MGATDLRLVARCVEEALAADHRLLEAAGGLDDAALRGPSRLPGWTRGHVLNHLRRNAEAFARVCDETTGGGTASMYPLGAAARDEGIAEGAADPPGVLVANLRAAVEGLEAAWARRGSGNWSGSFVVPSGSTVAITDVPYRRLRETVVHLTDLAIGIDHGEWPALFVRMELERQRMAWAASHPMGLTQFPAAVMALPDPLRLAWLINRAEVPGLGPGPGL